MEPRRGPLTAGEKVQFTDRKGKKITDQLVAGEHADKPALHGPPVAWRFMTS